MLRRPLFSAGNSPPAERSNLQAACELLPKLRCLSHALVFVMGTLLVTGHAGSHPG